MRLVNSIDEHGSRAAIDRSGRRPADRRLPAFVIVFVLVAAIGLGYTFLRKPEYRTSARVEIIPADGLQARIIEAGKQSSGAAGARGGSPFLTEVELLTSRPLLEQLLERLRGAGLSEAVPGTDPVLTLQRMISITTVEGTQVAQLAVIGETPEALAPILNGLMNIYSGHVADRYRNTTGELLAQAKEEASKYESVVAEKRRAMEAFRNRYNIVSLEREENETLSRARGLGASLNAAEEKAVAAEARLRSLQDSVAQGKATVRARDNPTLANLETRLSQAREEMRQLERNFTEDYLVKEPNAKLLKTRIAELEAQVRHERLVSNETNLAEAEEDAARTKETVDRLKGRLSADRQSIQAFSARFNDYKSLQEELKNLEDLWRGASEKLVRLEASESSRRPEAKIIEAATTPTDPWRPLYLRDSAITLAAAVLLGFLAAWLTAFLSRREDGPSVVIAPTAVAYPMGALGINMPAALAGGPDALAISQSQASLRLPPAPPAAKELDDDEVAALLRAADDRSRFVLAALLSGVAPEEVLPLTWADVDAERRLIRIASPNPREFAMDPELAVTMDTARGSARSEREPLVAAAGQGAPTAADLETLVACAAHDAGLDQAADMTPAALRHTYLAYMARQGARFSELTKLVGPLPASAIVYYGAMAPSGERRSIDDIDRVLPGMRRWATQLRGDSTATQA